MSVNIGLKNLLENKVVFFATILLMGLIFGLSFLNVGVAFGIYYKSSIYFEKFDADLWVFDNNPDRDHRVLSLADMAHLEKLKAMENVVSVTPNIIMPKRLYFNGTPIKGENVEMIGYDRESNVGGPWDVLEIDERNTHLENGAIINDNVAEPNGIRIGDTVDLVSADGQKSSLQVIGICRDAATVRGGMVFVPIELAQRLYPSGRKYTFYVVKTVPGKREDVRASIEKDGQLLALPKETITKETATYYLLSIGGPILISSLVLVIGCLIIIALYLHTQTAEKEREYAILKAVGAPAAYIGSIVLQQSLVISCSIFVIGFIFHLGYLAIFTDAIPNYHYKFNPLGIAIYFVIIIVVGFVASLFPLLSLRKVDPMEVFK